MMKSNFSAARRGDPRQGAFEDLIHVGGGTTIQVKDVGAVKHKPAGFYVLAVGIHHRGNGSSPLARQAERAEEPELGAC